MPHLRLRHGLVPLLHRLKFSPVVSIQGLRLCGKSTLARELLPQALRNAGRSCRFETLDSARTKDFAQKNPEAFLTEHENAHPLIIDEAQKAPDLFDEIKRSVDEDRRPGRFVLLGSTEFSTEFRVRESLTGRLSKIRIYPMNLAETLELPCRAATGFHTNKTKPRCTRKDLLRYIGRGGMPSLFHVRHEAERARLFEDWIQLTCERDVLQAKKGKIDTDLCRRLLELSATLEEPNAAAMAARVRAGGKKIATHLNILTQIFALVELKPHPLGSGKPLYFPADCGIAGVLGADFKRRLQTWFYIEAFSQHSYADLPSPPRFSYLRSKTGNRLDLILEDARTITAIKLMDEERFDRREIALLSSFSKKIAASGKQVSLFAYGAIDAPFKDGRIAIRPWESVV